jgi:hydrogenase-4 transcriptional activator
MDFVREVWRQAGRHIDIGEVIERVAPLVCERLPVDLLVLRQVDLERSQIETTAFATSGGPAPTLANGRTSCTPQGLRDLLAWRRAGTVLRSAEPAREGTLLALLVPSTAQGTWVAGPLGREERAFGVLLMRIGARKRFEVRHEEMVQHLLEPLSVALETHVRFHDLARLREALEADKRALLARLDRQEVSDAIVGEEAGLRDAMMRVGQVAPTDAPVLIIGDTGTGKEVIARAIHSRSHRARGPIVRVNCGALPPGLVDSELFGHERGSFTGAVQARQGWFERADGGTLFLDEVGELPLEAQVRLLRVLQDGTFERVGGQRTERVDVRLVAATHRDLHQMVREGTFREDLWYRIGVFPIRLPSLCERPEDIPALAAHFAARAGRRLGGGPLGLSQDEVALLLAYEWPGNVRELAAVIERATILGNGRELRIAAALGQGGSVPRRTRPRGGDTAAADEDLSLDAAMKQHIERVLSRTGGRIEGPFGAARQLAINPHTLRARMRKLRIEWSRFRASVGTP